MNSSQHAPLDRPIWSALTTRQTLLRQGGPLACRYFPDIAPFAALSPQAAHSEAAWQALHDLLAPHEQVALLSLEPVGPLGALEAERVGTLHQMIAPLHVSDTNDMAARSGIVNLAERDAPEMFDLAQKTKPGPFGKRTHQMGNYIGIRDEGRLIAMAGERMQLDGFVEISAVCVDGDYRGKGLAGRLINALREQITRRGDTPFLHVLSENHTAIALYERLGFERRQTFHLTRIKHANAA